MTTTWNQLKEFEMLTTYPHTLAHAHSRAPPTHKYLFVRACVFTTIYFLFLAYSVSAFRQFFILSKYTLYIVLTNIMLHFLPCLISPFLLFVAVIRRSQMWWHGTKFLANFPLLGQFNLCQSVLSNTNSHVILKLQLMYFVVFNAVVL